jgi:hypothetical protein
LGDGANFYLSFLSAGLPHDAEEAAATALAMAQMPVMPYTLPPTDQFLSTAERLIDGATSGATGGHLNVSDSNLGAAADMYRNYLSLGLPHDEHAAAAEASAMTQIPERPYTLPPADQPAPPAPQRVDIGTISGAAGEHLKGWNLTEIQYVQQLLTLNRGYEASIRRSINEHAKGLGLKPFEQIPLLNNPSTGDFRRAATSARNTLAQPRRPHEGNRFATMQIDTNFRTPPLV